MHFITVRKLGKCSGFVIYSYFNLNTVPLQQLKGMESSNYTGYMKGIPFVNRRNIEGVPCQKW